jgi:hypothetical protein
MHPAAVACVNLVKACLSEAKSRRKAYHHGIASQRPASIALSTLHSHERFAVAEIKRPADEKRIAFWSPSSRWLSDFARSLQNPHVF